VARESGPRVSVRLDRPLSEWNSWQVSRHSPRSAHCAAYAARAAVAQHVCAHIGRDAAKSHRGGSPVCLGMAGSYLAPMTHSWVKFIGDMCPHATRVVRVPATDARAGDLGQDSGTEGLVLSGAACSKMSAHAV